MLTPQMNTCKIHPTIPGEIYENRYAARREQHENIQQENIAASAGISSGESDLSSRHP